MSKFRFIERRYAFSAKSIYNPGIADGLDGLGAALAAMAQQGIEMKYDTLHKVLGKGAGVEVPSALERKIWGLGESGLNEPQMLFVLSQVSPFLWRTKRSPPESTGESHYFRSIEDFFTVYPITLFIPFQLISFWGTKIVSPSLFRFLCYLGFYR